MKPPPLRHGDPVTACDCALPGRITMDYGGPPGGRHFRVQFPPGSPFIDDWAVYRERELTFRPDKKPALQTSATPLQPQP